jgi:hypothetical protein
LAAVFAADGHVPGTAVSLLPTSDDEPDRP